MGMHIKRTKTYMVHPVGILSNVVVTVPLRMKPMRGGPNSTQPFSVCSALPKDTFQLLVFILFEISHIHIIFPKKSFYFLRKVGLPFKTFE